MSTPYTGSIKHENKRQVVTIVDRQDIIYTAPRDIEGLWKDKTIPAIGGPAIAAGAFMAVRMLKPLVRLSIPTLSNTIMGCNGQKNAAI